MDTPRIKKLERYLLEQREQANKMLAEKIQENEINEDHRQRIIHLITQLQIIEFELQKSNRRFNKILDVVFIATVITGLITLFVII